MTVTINGTSGITTPGVNSTASNTLGDAVGDTLNVGNGTIVTDSSGNVGIGTSSPSSPAGFAKSVTLYDAAGPSFVVDAGASYKAEFAISSGGGWLGTYNSIPMRFVTANQERMRIDSSGNLLVGTTSTSVTSGGFVFQKAGSTHYSEIGHASGVPSGDYFATYRYNGSVIGGVTQNGTTGVSYATSSDYRLKENIQPMQNALSVVQQLNPVTYNWKADGSDGQGFIAHELQAVVPDCVTGEKDAVDAEGNPVYQGIDTSFLVATLTKAIQELSAKNDALEARITALEAK